MRYRFPCCEFFRNTDNNIRCRCRKVENIFGRSGFFVANNIILSASALIVLIGTIYPIFYESFFSRQLTVGRSFYDILVGPLLLILVYLMVFSTKIAKVNMNLKKWNK